jgi:hypothetical protein
MNIKTEFFDEDVCYFCNDTIYNYIFVKLFDGRNIKSCFECNSTIQLGLKIYHNKITKDLSK